MENINQHMLKSLITWRALCLAEMEGGWSGKYMHEIRMFEALFVLWDDNRATEYREAKRFFVTKVLTNPDYKA